MFKQLILVDGNDNILGFENKEKCHNGNGILHRAFSIFVFNNKKELLIQQRSKFKRLWPLYWSNTCCSHPRRNETIDRSTKRRLKEEIGIFCDLKYLFKFQYQAKYQEKGSENELCYVLIGKYEKSITKPDPKEISDFKWINLDNLEIDIKKNPHKYTPWFKLETKELFSKYKIELDNLFK